MIEGLRLRFTNYELNELIDAKIQDLYRLSTSAQTYEEIDKFKSNVTRLEFFKAHLFDEEYSLTFDDFKQLGINL